MDTNTLSPTVAAETLTSAYAGDKQPEACFLAQC